MLFISRPTSPSKQQLPLLEKEPVDTQNDQSVAPGEEPRKFDSTGMFHWCPSRPLDTAVMVCIYLILWNVSLVSLSSIQHCCNGMYLSDSMGMFHWCLYRPLDTAVMVSKYLILWNVSLVPFP